MCSISRTRKIRGPDDSVYRHFQKSKPHERVCTFGREWFYIHQNGDGTLYVFPHGPSHGHSMEVRVRHSHSVFLGQSSKEYHRSAVDDWNGIYCLFERMGVFELYGSISHVPGLGRTS